MRGNSHVRFGGAGRGNGPPERATPRPGPTLLTVLAVVLPTPAGPLGPGLGAVFAFVLLACALVCFYRLSPQQHHAPFMS
jgi:hypothetical protein